MIYLDLEMPKGCTECFLCEGCKTPKDFPNIKCKAIGKVGSMLNFENERPVDCPIKEIVTCKECKHRNRLYTCEKLLVVMEDDCFCRFGKRRE